MDVSRGNMHALVVGPKILYAFFCCFSFCIEEFTEEKCKTIEGNNPTPSVSINLFSMLSEDVTNYEATDD